MSHNIISILFWEVKDRTQWIEFVHTETEREKKKRMNEQTSETSVKLS